MTNIILCGGSGTRLWPISRKLLPKQFVKLFNNTSLFQRTVERNSTLCHESIVVSNKDQYFLASDQLEELSYSTQSTFIIEPVGRNTAPAIALACMSVDEDSIVLVTPSDHIIQNQASYEKALYMAKAYAEKDSLVTFGIEPSRVETGYGYIEAHDDDVKRFHEKPDEKTAQQYLGKNKQEGESNFYWNSGIFCFKAGVYLAELKEYRNDIYEACEVSFKSSCNTHELHCTIDEDAMKAIPEESIDYAVMEKSKKVKVVPCDIGWNDLGSFDALYDELAKDDSYNAVLNEDTQNNIIINANNNLLLSSSHKIIAAIDVEDLIVVDSDDALLITKKGSTQKVKEVVKKLKDQGSELPNIHLTAHRPWGTYTVLEDTPGYKIKKIIVKPGKRLSLQKHYHRNEHWIVVSGTAKVTVGEIETLVRPNESTYIKMGEVHRLENPGKIDLILIEAQVGEYTGEDDIIRIDDDFKRV